MGPEQSAPKLSGADIAQREADIEVVTKLLGRAPAGAFDVVVRDADGVPVVIRNAPLLDSGRPMPTRYWLVGADIRSEIGRIESAGGVKAAEEAVGLLAIAEAHARYAAERDALIADDYAGPRPHDGVGGTRRGVKCLHAHYAWYLAGGDDPVGQWVQDQLDARVAENPAGENPARENPAGEKQADGA